MKYLKHGRVLTEAARRVGVDGNIGIQAISEAVARFQKRAVPETRQECWVFLREFVGSAPAKFKFKKARRSARAPIPAVATDAFLLSYEWRKLRMVVLKKRGARCECCGATPADGLRMHVDHIKPRRLFPELALTESNLQILCEECNHGKGNWDATDWRKDEIQHKPIILEREDRECGLRLLKAAGE